MDENYIASLLNALEKKNIKLSERKEISYGVQLSLSTEYGTEKLRVYQNNKGKITLDSSPIKAAYVKEAVAEFTSGSSAEKRLIVAPPLIGTDEAGKGDYFGPLCVGAVYADSQQFKQLISCGVKDSKLLNDQVIHKLSLEIKRICPSYEIIVIGNERFNDMYAQIKNMGSLLGWAHAQAISKLLNRTACKNVLTDKYGNERWLANRLTNYDIELTQVPKAEINPAVAAASILARDAFVSCVARMSHSYGIDIPLGAGANVDSAARVLSEKFGNSELYNAVKISFKNTERVLPQK